MTLAKHERKHERDDITVVRSYTSSILSEEDTNLRERVDDLICAADAAAGMARMSFLIEAVALASVDKSDAKDYHYLMGALTYLISTE